MPKSVISKVYKDKRSVKTIVCLLLFSVFLTFPLSMSGCGEDSNLKKGKSLIASGDYVSAIRHLKESVQKHPDDPEAYYQLGVAYLRSKEEKLALNALKTSAKLAPKRYEVQLALAEAHLNSDQRQQALRILLEVVQNSNRKDILAQVASLTGDAYPTERIVAETMAASSPASSAQNIAFVVFTDDNHEIFIAPKDNKAKAPKRLTFNDTSDYSPSISPDENSIVYVSFFRWGSQSNDEIFIMDTDGKNQTRLTNNSFSDGGPSFSPDGKSIVFDSNPEGNSEIYLMNRDGSGLRRLTYTKTESHAPVFSKDGKSIAFASYSASDRPVSQIYIIDSDGKNQKKLTHLDSINANPFFSPDGKWIVFESDRDGDGEIFIIDVNGKNERQLTRNDNIDSDPTFSTDGKTIFFASQRHDRENIGIYAMRLDKTFTRAELINRIKSRLIE